MQNKIKNLINSEMRKYLRDLQDKSEPTDDETTSFFFLQEHKGRCYGLSCDECYLDRVDSTSTTLCNSLGDGIEECVVGDFMTYRGLAKLALIEIILEEIEISRRLCGI